jgi:hypothetical protein
MTTNDSSTTTTMANTQVATQLTDGDNDNSHDIVVINAPPS